jgi:DUF4097 and DUF4098 domain-containing protein YvlB
VKATSDFAATHPWDGYKRVEVSVRNGAVELRSADVHEIKISGRKFAGGLTLAEAEANLAKVEVYAALSEQRADTFVVELRYPLELASKSVGAEVLIEVPEPCAADLTTSNGPVRASGLKDEVKLSTSNGAVRADGVVGRLTVDTSNGNADVDNVQGDATVSSSNGGLTVRGVQGRCVLSTSNGGIRAEDLSGDVEIKTSNGNIRLVAASGRAGRIDLRSSNGSIHASLPPDLAAQLRLRTSNGRVRVSLGQAALEPRECSRTRFEGTMNGGGGLVTAETSNGSITVDSR